jgi:hypothetical protein
MNTRNVEATLRDALAKVFRDLAESLAAQDDPEPEAGQENGREYGPMTAMIRKAMVASGMSLGEMERRSGVSRAQLSRFASGTRSLTLPAVEKLCPVLGLKLVADEPATKRGKKGDSR